MKEENDYVIQLDEIKHLTTNPLKFDQVRVTPLSNAIPNFPVYVDEHLQNLFLWIFGNGVFRPGNGRRKIQPHNSQVIAFKCNPPSIHF